MNHKELDGEKMRLRWLLTIMCLIISLIPVAMISGLQGLEIATIFLGLILLITLTVAFVVSYFISMPLVKLTEEIDEISKGNLDVELEKSEIYEINNLTKSLDRVMASLKLAINKMGVRKEEIFENAVKAKQQAEQKLEVLLKKIDGWIWETDEKGTCTVCSNKVADTLGYFPKDLIGRDIFGVLPPNDAKKLKDMILRISQDKTSNATKLDLYWTKKANSKPVWVRSFIIPVFDCGGTFQGLRCFSRDASEHRFAEDTIADLQKKIGDLDRQLHEIIRQQEKETTLLEPIIDTATKQDFDYMILFDEKTKIVDCTENIEKQLGYSKQEMLSLSFTDLVYLESSYDIKASLDEIKTQGNMYTKNIHKKKDGASVFVSEHIRYLKDRNLFICMVKQDKM
jgi:PAS domain S-box-containing protein